jgi:hypothetical protein
MKSSRAPSCAPPKYPRYSPTKRVVKSWLENNFIQLIILFLKRIRNESKQKKYKIKKNDYFVISYLNEIKNLKVAEFSQKKFRNV